MTPERWRRIDELFADVLEVAPQERSAWLALACGADAELRAEVDRLLEDDEQAGRDGFLAPPEDSAALADATATWPPRPDRAASRAAEPVERARDRLPAQSRGFAPKAAIAAATGTHATGEGRSLAQARLRELTLIYLLIVGMMLFWRNVVLGNQDLVLSIVYAATIAVLGGIAALLSRRRSLPPSGLKSLELGMIALIAVIFAFSQYQAMLQLSALGEITRAQLVMKNRVLITSILILCYGIYAPRSWRQAALVVGPLALLPFATLAVLYVRQPAAMAWVDDLGRDRGTGPLALFGFDAMLLLILAAGSASGAHAIERLRRQVVEARQLGQYRLRQRIGEGGMGEVYLAEHQLLKRPCALKLVRPACLADPQTLERFEREVRITATLSHPNTVEIYDYGRTEDGIYYYVMEYLPGLSLAELVERHGAVPPGRAVYLLRQVCAALCEAHAAGLIHRDVKPSNIFAARRGGMDDIAKLLDFGLVRPAATVGSAHGSTHGQILGTPLFMSPEQARGGRALDERSDIYSLGAVAYYLLTGRPPFDLPSGIEVMIAHARDPVVPPSVHTSDLPPDLEQVVLRCLAKDPAERFPDAASLGRALAECSCAASWDQDRAGAWWREHDQVGSAHLGSPADAGHDADGSLVDRTRQPARAGERRPS